MKKDKKLINWLTGYWEPIIKAGGKIGDPLTSKLIKKIFENDKEKFWNWWKIYIQPKVDAGLIKIQEV